MASAPLPARRAVTAAVCAYSLWGTMPVFFWFARGFSALEIITLRILWSMALLAIIVGIRRDWGRTLLLLRDQRILRALMMSGGLILSNWLLYTWAVLNGHVLAGSLGYFLNPLMNVALGIVVLGERLRPAQKAAVGLACVGVAVMAVAAVTTLWISLLLGASFALYGLIRKTAPVGPLDGLTLETLLLAPVAVVSMISLVIHGTEQFGQALVPSLATCALGIMTTIPLLLFSVAARSLPLATLGLIQYIAPTLVFILGITLFDETLSAQQLASFGIIWSALALYTLDTVRAARQKSAEDIPAPL
ncbi:EamA family transporter RarD [Sphingobium subterraneum]|uniref:Chloramphenicol-sensitive protein RarD n=1 Tax=Sphingobium subterraneum TaxID=627688 RepID=A0A841IZM7_9SPHN|nr:EamA family transporter RarD [Sphingobium subterraneum]MBB6123874.1 chloramphenicol-sensitive protein RarD [Sphingobium subterraneum]